MLVTDCYPDARKESGFDRVVNVGYQSNGNPQVGLPRRIPPEILMGGVLSGEHIPLPTGKNWNKLNSIIANLRQRSTESVWKRSRLVTGWPPDKKGREQRKQRKKKQRRTEFRGEGRQWRPVVNSLFRDSHRTAHIPGNRLT